MSSHGRGDRAAPRPHRLAAHRPLGRRAGRRVDVLRPARARRVDRPVRPRRSRGRGLAAAGLGRGPAPAPRPAPAVGLHPLGPARLRRARRRHRRGSRCSSWPRSPGCRWAPRARWSSSVRSASRWPAAVAARLRWPALAAVGVVLLTEPWRGTVDLGRRRVRAGRGRVLGGVHPARPSGSATRWRVCGGLRSPCRWPALVATVVAGPSTLGHLTVDVVVIGLGLAVLLPVVPFSLELLALRRLTSAAFGTLMSLEPAIALLVGPGRAAARCRERPRWWGWRSSSSRGSARSAPGGVRRDRPLRVMRAV